MRSGFGTVWRRRYSDTDANCDTDADCNANADSDSNADADADTRADVRPHGGFGHGTDGWHDGNSRGTTQSAKRRWYLCHQRIPHKCGYRAIHLQYSSLHQLDGLTRLHYRLSNGECGGYSHE